MMQRSRLVSALGIIAAALLLTGCASQSFRYHSDDAIDDAFRAGAAVTELSARSPDHVAGNFRIGETEYAFSSRHAADQAELVIEHEGDQLLVARWTQSHLALNVFDEQIRIPISGGESLFNDGQDQRLTPAIQRFARTDIYRSLPKLSRSLAMLGVTGRSHPASLSIHRTALASETLFDGIDTARPDDDPERVPLMYANPQFASQLTKIAINDFDLVDDIYGCDQLAGPFIPPEMFEALSEACSVGGGVCQDLQDDPNDDDCDGMCGPGCAQCWKWVCGDCCAYVGCQVHDDLTRDCEENGFSGTGVLSCPAAGLFFPIIPLTNIFACGFSL